MEVPLALLEACQTGEIWCGRCFGSVAPALLRAGVGSVIAFSHAVTVTAARILVERFYQEVCKGKSVGAALNAGRAALGPTGCGSRPRQGDLTLIDWHVAQLYQAGADPVLVPGGPGPGSSRDRAAPAGESAGEGISGGADVRVPRAGGRAAEAAPEAAGARRGGAARRGRDGEDEPGAGGGAVVAPHRAPAGWGGVLLVREPARGGPGGAGVRAVLWRGMRSCRGRPRSCGSGRCGTSASGGALGLGQLREHAGAVPEGARRGGGGVRGRGAGPATAVVWGADAEGEQGVAGGDVPAGGDGAGRIAEMALGGLGRADALEMAREILALRM